MAISIRGTATVTASGTAVGSINPAIPTGTTTGDLSVLIVGMKPYTATISTPTNWTKVAEYTNGTVASGADVGSMKIAMFVRESAPTGTIGSLGFSGADTAIAIVHSYQKALNEVWDFSAFTSANDNSSGSGFSATSTTHFSVLAGDWVLGAGAGPTDAGTASNPTVSGMSGATLGTNVVRIANGVTTTGNDMRLTSADRPVTAGSSSSSLTYAWTNSTSTPGGVAMLLRLRAVAPDNTKIHTFSDDFSVDNRATKWPDWYGNTTVSGGVATVTSILASNQYSGLQTSLAPGSLYSLVESYVKVKVTVPSSSTTDPYGNFLLLPTAPAGTGIAMQWNGALGTMTAGLKFDYGFTASADFSFPTGTTMYIAMAEGVAGAAHFGKTGTAGNLYFYSSPDGITWTQRYTTATPTYAGAVAQILGSDSYVAGTAAFVWDDYNIDVAPPGFTGTLDRTGTGALATAASSVNFDGTLALSGVGTTKPLQDVRDTFVRQPVEMERVNLGTDSVTVNVPKTAQVGDLLLYVYHTRELTNTNHAIPSGWTALASGNSATRGNTRLAYKTVASGDIGSSFTISGTDIAPSEGLVSLIAIANVDTSNITAMTEAATNFASGSTTQLQFPARTPTQDESLHVMGGMAWHSTLAVSNTAKSTAIHTTANYSSPAGNDLAFFVAQELRLNPGVTGPTRVAVYDQTVNMFGWSLVMRPVPAVQYTPTNEIRYYDTASTMAAIDAATTIGEIEDALDAMQAAYGVTAEFGMTISTTFGSRSWTNPVIGDTHLKPAVKKVVDSLAKYPPEFIKQVGPENIIFCKNIVNSEAPEADIGGFVSFVQMFLDIENEDSGLGLGYIFHHELNHVMGNVFGANRSLFQTEWEALNPVGFTYLGASYNDAYTGDWPEGFVRSYARYSFVEDFAETVGILFSTVHQPLLAEMVAEDPIIAGKIALMKRWLAERSEGRISGEPYYAAIHTAVAEDHTGSVTLTGAGATSGTGSAAVPGTLTRTGGRTLGLTGVPAAPGTLALSGSRTLGVSGVPSATGTRSLGQSGSLANTGVPNINQTLALSGTRSLSLPGTSQHAGSLSLSHSRTFAATAQRKMLGVYWPGWNTGGSILNVDTDYNFIFPFACQREAGTGNVSWAWGPIEDLQAARARGQKAILSVGGSGQGIDFSSRTISQQFIDSFQSVVTSMGGVDGVDFNTFEAEVNPNLTEYIWMSQQLRSIYGPDFIVTCPPAPWSTRDQDFCRGMLEAGAMNWVSPQYYDGPGLAEKTYVVSSIDNWVANVAGGDASKIAVGFGVAELPNYMTTAVAVDTFQTVKANHPNIRGAFLWQRSADADAGWPFANQMGPLVQDSGAVGTLSLTGTGGVSAAGAPNWVGVLSLSGSRTLNLSGAPGQTSPLTLTGSRTLGIAGAPGLTGTSALTGSRTLGMTGAFGASGALALGQARGLTVSGAPAPTGSVFVTQAGGLARGGAPGITNTLALSATRTLALPGTSQHVGTWSRSLATSLTVNGAPSQSSALNLGQVAALMQSGTASVPGTLTRSGNGSLGLTGETASAGSLSRAMVGSLLLSGSPSQSSSLNVGQAGALSGTGVPAIQGGLTRAIDSGLSLSGDGTINASGDLNLTGGRTLGLSGAPGWADSVALGMDSDLSAVMNAVTVTATMSRTMTRTLGLGGSAAVAGALGLTAVIGESLSGSPGLSGSLTRTGDGDLGTNQTAVTTGGTLSRSMARTLALAASAITAAGALNLTGARALVLAGSASSEGEGSYTATHAGILTLTGVPNYRSTLGRAGTGSLLLAGSPGGAGALTLEHTMQVTVDGVPGLVGDLSLSTIGELLLDGSPVVEGSLIIGGTRELYLFGGSSNKEMFFKDGSRAQAFILLGGMLIPVIPQIGD